MPAKTNRAGPTRRRALEGYLLTIPPYGKRRPGQSAQFLSALGLRYARKIEISENPRLIGLVPRDTAPQIPLLYLFRPIHAGRRLRRERFGRRGFSDCRVPERAVTAAIPTTPPASEKVTLREDHQAVIEIKVVGFQHAGLVSVNRGRRATKRAYGAHARSRFSVDDSASQSRRLCSRLRTATRRYEPFSIPSYVEQSRATI